jgi:plasmid stability protein
VAKFDIIDIKWSSPMPDILIRDIDPELKRMIQARARSNKRSMSVETKAILKRALAQSADRPATTGMGTFLGSLIPLEEWTDDFIQSRDTSDREPPDFS